MKVSSAVTAIAILAHASTDTVSADDATAMRHLMSKLEQFESKFNAQDAKIEAQAAELKLQKAEIARLKAGENNNNKVIKGSAGTRRRLQRMMQEDPLVPETDTYASKSKSTYSPSSSPTKAPTPKTEKPTETPTSAPTLSIEDRVTMLEEIVNPCLSHEHLSLYEVAQNTTSTATTCTLGGQADIVNIIGKKEVKTTANDIKLHGEIASIYGTAVSLVAEEVYTKTVCDITESTSGCSADSTSGLNRGAGRTTSNVLPSNDGR